MHCISSSTLRLLWNGNLMEELKPTRGAEAVAWAVDVTVVVSEASASGGDRVCFEFRVRD
ncbi:hypothetical protein J1N35_009782 [Gossypium stocksii]|uniref:Uncharacterized protein n=1 Tax=Gossypium stocksii TaxID=47602 RepID=A0A9D3VZ98_9ROSI|nr:hypothetical protein J1N35_009782 [Gossypium stocksii]